MTSDDEDFVAYGTPLEPLEEDEPIPTKIPIHEQTVHDEKGRRRFHGAFTGGFSAGYYNTVGSKEGWAPSAFQSSRSQKADRFKQNPEDFMDSEDLGVFGIASRRVQTTDNFNYKEEENRKRNFPVLSDGPIPGEPPLKELVKPVRETIGVKLLQKMGWKQGQGIGPRIEKMQKSISTKGKKIYGCALPPTEDNEENNNDEDDPYAVGFTFAPKDIEILPYTPKNNLHGIGYSGLNKNPILSSHINLFEPTHTSSVLEKKRKLLISGQAFGVGAFEDEDEDIYAKDDMTQYDYFLEGTSQIQDAKEKPKKKTESIKEILEGFCLATKTLLRKKNYPPPVLPSNFKPIHQVRKKFLVEKKILDNRFLDRHNMNAHERTKILDDEPSLNKKGSVFDLLSIQDKQKLEKVKKEMQENVVISTSSQERQNQSFKPFQNDKAKQARYEQYLSLMRIEKKDCLEQLQPKSMTEWEKQREKEEFQRAAVIYRPLSTSLSSRFISSSILENDREIEVRVDEQNEKSDQKKAAEMKMFGRLTREKFEWHPAKVLCKRFNVPNPYNDSTMVGLPKIKRDKYSLFNFLTVPTENNPPKLANESLKPSDSVSEETLQKEIHSSNSESIKAERQMDSKKILELEKKEEDGRPSMDLFKAIFQNTSSENSSSSDEEVSNEQENESASNMSNSSQKNLDIKVTNSSNNENVKRTNPAFGIFANIDLVAINQQTENNNMEDKPLTQTDKNPNSFSTEEKKNSNLEDSFYGPKLPPSMPVICEEKKRKENEKLCYKKNKKDKHHKHKKHKSKSKKVKHKHKSKHKKTNQRSSSSSEESSESESEIPSNLQILQRFHQLERSKDL